MTKEDILQKKHTDVFQMNSASPFQQLTNSNIQAASSILLLYQDPYSDHGERFFGNLRPATVKSLVWITVNSITGLTDRELHVRMGIILRTIASWFLVFYVSVPGCFRNGSRECPYKWVQEKFI